MFFLLYRQKNSDKVIEGNDRNNVIDKLTCEIIYILWKINHSGPGCNIYKFYETVSGIFPSKTLMSI